MNIKCKKLVKAFLFIILSYSGIEAGQRDIDFHTHPLVDMSQAERDFARARIIEITREGSRAKEGLVKVMIISGEFKTEIAHAKYFSSGVQYSELKKNTNVLVSYKKDISGPKEIFIEDFDRTGKLAILILIFIVLVLIVGGKRSLYPLIALFGGILIIKLILIPTIITGGAPLIYTFITVTAVVGLAMLAIYGKSEEAIIGFSGSMGGVIGVVLLGLIFYDFSNITGVYMEEIQLMEYVGAQNHFQTVTFYRDFLISILVLASAGVIMDAAISITSSIKEALNQGVKDPQKISLVGKSVKEDIIVTMVNTLVVAFLGASLGQLLIQRLHIGNFWQLINSEFFHVQFYYVFIGTLGFLISAQITEKFASWFLK